MRMAVKQHRFKKTITSIGIIVGLAVLAGCGDSSEKQLNQIAVWEDQGWTADGQLTKLMFEGNDEVRARATLAMARVNDTLTIDSVRLAYLNDSDPNVRATAAFVYGAGQWRKGAAHVVESLERDEDPQVIRETLQAMIRVYARDDYQKIFPFLRHDDPAIRAQGLLTLNGLNRRDEVDSLVRMLDDPDRTVQWCALFTLLGARTEAGAVAALPFLRDTSVEMRRLAYRVVGASPDLTMKDTLLQGLNDSNPLVRASAAEAFGLQPDTISIVKTYPYLETEENPLVLMSLLKALGDHWRAGIEPYLREFMKHKDPGVRAQAVKAATRRLDGDFADVIAPAVTDPSPQVRMAWCEAIDNIATYIQFDREPLQPYADSLTFDTVPRVRARALQTYLTLNGPNSAAHLNRIYNDADRYCQQMAINLIGTFRLQMYQDSLYEFYPTIIDMWRPELKWAILAASANMSPSVQPTPVRREIFTWGIDDPNRLVRWYSIAVWEKFREDHRDKLGTYKTDLTVENVDELLHPYAANPLAHLETTRGRITLELLQDRAPRAVRRFIEIARAGIYDGCWMNDIQPGNIVQTGDTRVNGWGLPGETVRDELQPDRVDAGDVLWLINSRDSGHGAFGLVLSRSPYLDWRYSRFAKIVDGLDVARSLTYSDTVRTVTIETPDAI
ncbi:MAG: hypothetical protein GF341_13765 [candidate division Zixibacteria bacterium]|nr:hypothetical protein [candidate division Zixibacteria bacterium]